MLSVISRTEQTGTIKLTALQHQPLWDWEDPDQVLKTETSVRLTNRRDNDTRHWLLFQWKKEAGQIFIEYISHQTHVVDLSIKH